MYGDMDEKIRMNCERIKEKMLSTLNENNQLLKRVRVLHSLLKFRIEEYKKLTDCKLQEKLGEEKTVREMISQLKSNDSNLKKEAVEILIEIARDNSNNDASQLAKNVLSDELRNGFEYELAEKILFGFFDTYLHSGESAVIRWAAKFHSSEEIREMAKEMLIHISNIEAGIKKEEWKKRFKEKVKKYRERTEKYNGFKEKITSTQEEEKYIEFKNDFTKRLSWLVSVNAVEEEIKVRESIRSILKDATIKKLFYKFNQKIENVDTIDLYHLSINFAIAILREDLTQNRIDELNLLIEKKFL